MEKVLVVINARQPDTNTIDFACRIAADAQTKLTGLFVENLFFEHTPQATAKGKYFKSTGTPEAGVVADTDQAVRIFREECRHRGVKPDIYIDKGEPIEEVIHESRYADLLILDPDITFYERKEKMPSDLVRTILSEAECPVLLAPDTFEGVHDIVFTYDGSASSVFAIKQFSYLFPEYNTKQVTLLRAGRKTLDECDEDDRRMIRWMKDHYSSVQFEIHPGRVKDELFNRYFMKRNVIVVMGAYGRSLLSNIFRKSSADMLIRNVDLPLFISHH